MGGDNNHLGLSEKWECASGVSLSLRSLTAHYLVVSEFLFSSLSTEERVRSCFSEVSKVCYFFLPKEFLP